MKHCVNNESLLIVLLCVFLCNSCKNSTDDFIEETEENTEVETDKKSLIAGLIEGDWEFYSGDLFVMLGAEERGKLNHQIISFMKNGNYSETNIFDFDDDINVKGNYKLDMNKIIFNDWEGNQIDKIYKIESVTENQLVISTENKESATFVRDAEKYYSELILGEWNSSQRYFKFWDGSMKIESNGNLSVPIYYYWKISNNILYWIKIKTGKVYNDFTIVFCNSMYMRMEKSRYSYDCERINT